MPRKANAYKTPRKTKAGSAREAYDLLGIAEADVLGVPKIEPMLAESGVLPKVWDYLAASSEDVALKIIAMRARLATQQQRNSIPFEAYCVAAGFEPKKVLSVIIAEVYSQNEQAALLMAASAQPGVVQATVTAALHPTGSRERDMLHKHSGFVPVPKTSVVHVHGGKNVIGGGQQTNQELAVLAPLESVVRRISDRFNERLLSASGPLIEATQEPDDEVEEVDDDD